MLKRTYKLRGLGDVAGIIAAAPSIAAAARQLGVARKTVHAWINEGKTPRPGGRPRKAPAPAPATVTTAPAADETPREWAARVRQAYDLSAVELRLLGLAERALTLASDDTVKPELQLAAMARYQSLVKQIDLPQEEPADGTAEAPPAARWPRRVV